MNDFDPWYREAYPKLLRALTLTLGSADEAADASAEACVKAYEQWDRVRAMGNPDGWAFQVAYNAGRRRGRRRSTERRLVALHLGASAAHAPAAEALGELERLTAALPARMREVVVLRHVADLTEPTIAEVLGISRGTVSSTLRDAYRRIADVLDDEHEEVTS